MKQAAGLVLLLALLAGCGGGPTPAAPATTAPPATAAATTTGPATTAAPTTGLTVTSAAFPPGGAIPRRYTCQGAGTRPPLAWTGNTAGAAALAVVVHDPDAPSGDFIHWVVLDLPAGTHALAGDGLPAGARQARNSAGSTGWTPPCPPSGTHHYHFVVYALRAPSGLPDGTDPAAARAVLARTALAQGELVGTVASG